MGEPTTAELAVELSDIADSLEAITATERRIRKLGMPAAVITAVAAWLALVVVGGGGTGVWVLSNALLFLGLVKGAGLYKGRERRQLLEDRDALLQIGSSSAVEPED